MIRATRSGAAAVLVALALSAVLAGCAVSAPPDSQPSIRGPITSISAGAEGFGTILVEETSPQGLSFDKASLAITKDTKLLKRDGDGYVEFAYGGLSEGMFVEVWITGPVRESYPVQADADTLVVLE